MPPARNGRSTGPCARRPRWSAIEIPLGICVVVPVLIAGTMDLVDIGQQQAGWFSHWNLHQSVRVRHLLDLLTCAMASTNRAPFDLPEAESELVAGFMTEYSGFRWAMFFMAEYRAMFLLALWARSCSSAAGTARSRSPHGWGLTACAPVALPAHGRQLPGHVQFHRQRLSWA